MAHHSMLTYPQVEERLDCRGQHSGSGLGFSMDCGESPQKIWSVGCETSRGIRETALTVSAFSLPQFTQMHSSIFLTFTRKPTELLLIMILKNNTSHTPG